ncbi:MAG: N-acetylmuramoyl-L-alanine amidase [Muribaculaceae bacterium]|nr:N-acetylmuramoyl-L-alanine amidase [Muribaculaceae bacterium]
MKNPIITLAAVLLATQTAFSSDELSLRIYSGKRDTVTVEKQTIVGVTDPGASATINGTNVKVYKTGSFGGEVSLQPGENDITVTVKKGNATATESFNIFRKEKNDVAVRPNSLDNEKTMNYDSPIYVKTTQGAYLQFGNGDDRLGGSKMGFLVPDINLKIDGEKGELYRVRLSQNRFAYIPKEYTEPSTSWTPVVNTGSWNITNQGTFDRVSVSLPTKLAYQYRTDIDPSMITIDIFGATDNSNWITQRTLNLGIIDYVTYEQTEGDVYRVIIKLKEKYQWGFSIGYNGSALTIDVRHRPSSQGLKGLKIGLDAGHGGEYPGAISPSGLKEKDLNLDIVLKLRDMLEKAGATVVLTRDSDTGPSMTERKRILKEANVDLSLSIHNNSGGGALTSPGTAALYKHTFDRPLAVAIASRILEMDVPFYGLVGNFNFSLNGPTDYPNMLVEGLFMSSLQEEELLADPDFRTKMARQIFLGLEDYMKEVKNSLKK